MANKQTSQCALVDHYCPRLCCWILGFSQCVLNTQALHNMFTQVFFSASHWETETDYSNTAAYLPPFPSWANLSFDSLQGKRVKPLPTTTATTEYSLHRQIAAAHCMAGGCSQECVWSWCTVSVRDQPGMHFRVWCLTKRAFFSAWKVPISHYPNPGQSCAHAAATRENSGVGEQSFKWVYF